MTAETVGPTTPDVGPVSRRISDTPQAPDGPGTSNVGEGRGSGEQPVRDALFAAPGGSLDDEPPADGGPAANRTVFRPPSRSPDVRPQDPRATVRWARMPSPVGDLLLLSDGEALTGLYLGSDHRWGPGGVQPHWVHDPRALAEPLAQLRAYFAGELRRFDLALAPRGTPFQLRVWRALLDVGYGRTASYGQIARALGQPSASRAVGAANGRNPVSIVVPCHRVIGAGGALTGYGGGLPRKRRLLALESGLHPNTDRVH